MNQETTFSSATQISRRRFLSLGLAALSALALAEVGGASLIFLQPRSLEGEFGGVVTAGSVDSFAPGSVTEFPDGRFFLVRMADGGFLALYNRCTHLGCAVTWQAENNGFFCPCHASNFDQSGEVMNAPATRPLDSLALTIEQGHVVVDTGRIQTRDGFAIDQLVYA